MMTKNSCSRLRIIKEVKEFQERGNFTAHDLCKMTGLTAQQVNKFMDYPSSYDHAVMNAFVDLLNTPLVVEQLTHGKRFLRVMPHKEPISWAYVPLDYVYKAAEW